MQDDTPLVEINKIVTEHLLTLAFYTDILHIMIPSIVQSGDTQQSRS